MQRRHFELIAETLKGLSLNWGGHLNDASHARVVEDFADKLASTNPNFDRARFLRACGVES